MENEKAPPYVEYFCADSTVRVVKDVDPKSSGPQRRMPQEGRSSRCKPMLVLKIMLPFSLIILGPILTFIFLRYTETGGADINEAPPDVAEVSLVEVGVDSFTAKWARPKGRVDYYWINVTGGSNGESMAADSFARGSCGSGTILHSSQTSVTCDRLPGCTNLTFLLRTHLNGPPERTSGGAMLRDIYIPGEALESPLDITIVGESPQQSRLNWKGPHHWSGVLGAYTVKVCSAFSTCDAGVDDVACTDYHTTETWLIFDSTVDTAYCVLVTASAKCGADVISSRPVAAEVRTPAFRPPDVVMARATAVWNSSFTVSWERPIGRFDYYWIEVTEGDGSQHRSVGSCSSSILLPPQRTHLSCDNVKSCTNASVTIYTQVNSPPERISDGVSIRGIFFPEKELRPPENITVTWKSPSVTRVQWEPIVGMSGTLGPYNVSVCDGFGGCGFSEPDRGCVHHQTPKTWLEFESTPDTEYCVLVTSSAQCGKYVLRSAPGSMEIRTPTFVPSDVANLTLEDVRVDSFTVSWERPKGYFDYYWVEVTDDAGVSGGRERYRMDSCRNGTILHPEQTRITCSNLEACTTASIRVRTHNNGPPTRTSAGVTLGGIFIPGEEPGGFKVEVRATSNTSAEVVVHVSHIKDCLVDECKGDCSTYTGEAVGRDHLFTCNGHSGNASTVLLTGLQPGSDYICSISLHNVHKGQWMSSTEYEGFTTPS